MHGYYTKLFTGFVLAVPAPSQKTAFVIGLRDFRWAQATLWHAITGLHHCFYQLCSCMAMHVQSQMMDANVARLECNVASLTALLKCIAQYDMYNIYAICKRCNMHAGLK